MVQFDGEHLRLFSIGTLSLLLWAATVSPTLAISLDRLDEGEISTLRAILNRTGPFIADRKAAGIAPLLTFEQLYAPLTLTQVAFCEAIRQINPADLQGSSRKLPPPNPDTSHVRFHNQVIWKDGKPIRLDTQYLPRSAAEDYQRMMIAMEADLGKRLLIESGYRSPAYQLYLFLFYMPKHGHSIRETNRHVALPGCSEHGSPSVQAIDFITPEGVNGEDHPEEFEELQEYGWLQARAKEFGFYLSYPRGGPSAFEPWHWHWESSEE